MLIKGALCLQGGAMRSVFTDGVIDCLIDNNIDIENVFGISAASKDMMYYPMHQKRAAFECNLMTVKDPNTFNMANALLGKPVIDSNYFIQNIRNKFFPYDMDKIKNSKMNLFIGATNIETGEIEYFTKDDSDIDKTIEASCSLPVIQPIIEIRDNKYLDGGIAENIPFNTAIKRGFDKIVVVSTRERGFVDTNNMANIQETFYQMKYSSYPKLFNRLMNLANNYNKELEQMDELEKSGRIFVLRPSKDFGVERLERDTNKLEALYNDGYNTCQKNLEALLNYLK